MPDSLASNSPRLSPTTRWSLIVAAGSEDGDPEKVRQALEQLCQMYWRPVMQFIRARGYSEADAKDLTQDFFLRFSETEFMQKARTRFGRFRALVFSALKHLLWDEADRRGAIKRGGRLEFVSLEDWMEAEGADGGPADPAMVRACQLFDYEWATLVVRNALARLQDDFTARGKVRQFDVLRPYLTGGDRSASYAEAAAALALPVGTVRAMIHQLRGKYGNLLRDEVAQTVADARDLDGEIQHLRQILAARQEIMAFRAGPTVEP